MYKAYVWKQTDIFYKIVPQEILQHLKGFNGPIVQEARKEGLID
jgi:hypothetical protein